jgi:hypothetical protein
MAGASLRSLAGWPGEHSARLVQVKADAMAPAVLALFTMRPMFTSMVRPAEARDRKESR